MYIRYSFHLNNGNVIIRYINVNNGFMKTIEQLDSNSETINNDNIYISREMKILKSEFIYDKYNKISDEDINLLLNKSSIYSDYINSNKILLLLRVFVYKNHEENGFYDIELFTIDSNYELHPIGYDNEIFLPPNWDIRHFYRNFNKNCIKNKCINIFSTINELNKQMILNID